MKVQTTKNQPKNQNPHEQIRKLTLSAMFIALGIVLPFVTEHIHKVGNMLLPMHIPVFLCGLICGWQYGAAVGFVLPLMRSMMFAMPPMIPAAVAMAPELMTYGLVAGLLYGLSRHQCIIALYRSMIIAMLAGRVVWGAARIVLLFSKGTQFTWGIFLSDGFLTAIPGILIQLFLIPAIMLALHKTGLVKFKQRDHDRHTPKTT